MTKQPLISVITPCYNAERFIDSCIQSVLSQTYKNWELILVDDCSTDDTLNKIQMYSKLDNRIKYYTTKRTSGGPSHPRNIGITTCTGDFVAFLDADDLWLPEKLSEQIEFALENNYQFVYSNYEKISSEGFRQGRRLRMKAEVDYKYMLRTCEIPCLTVLIHKNLIKNRLFKEFGKEDYLLWLEILRTGVKAYNTGRVHALYRQQDSSRSSNKIKMLYEQWIILRDFQKISFFQSCFDLFFYVIRGLQKYFR